MKKLFLLLLLCLAGTHALAQEEGVVVQSSCSISRSGEYYLVSCYAKVNNATDTCLCLDEGTLYLTCEEGVIAETQVQRIWPAVLGPGEDGYLYDFVLIDPAQHGGQMPQVTGIAYNITYLTMEDGLGSQQLGANAVIESSGYGLTYVVCELHNAQPEVCYDASVGVGLYTESGQMVYAGGMSLQDVGIPADGRVMVRFAVDSMLMEQWQGYGAVPVRAEVSAAARRSMD